LAAARSPLPAVLAFSDLPIISRARPLITPGGRLMSSAVEAFALERCH
jgi:hypothetical protein